MLDYIKPLANGRIIVIHSFNDVVRFEVVHPNRDLAEDGTSFSRALFPRRGDYAALNSAIIELEFVARKLADFVETSPGTYEWMDYAYDLVDDAEKKLAGILD